MKRLGYVLLGMVLSPLLLVLLFNVVNMRSIPSRPVPALEYSDFLAKIEDGSIRLASITGKHVLVVTNKGESFSVWVFSPEKIADKLVEKGVKVAARPEDADAPSWLGVLINWLPLIVIMAAFWFSLGIPLRRIDATLQTLKGYLGKE